MKVKAWETPLGKVLGIEDPIEKHLNHIRKHIESIERMGDRLIVKGSFTTGTNSGKEASIPLPKKKK